MGECGGTTCCVFSRYVPSFFKYQQHKTLTNTDEDRWRVDWVADTSDEMMAERDRMLAQKRRELEGEEPAVSDTDYVKYRADADSFASQLCRN